MKEKSILNNFIWRFAERIGAQGVSLIVSIILARILIPDDYGVIALVTVFITILNVFVDSGLGNALVQKKDADDLDFSSVFWFNIIWCIILYCILYLVSPVISLFFERPELVLVLRILGIQIIISGVKNVEQAYVTREMQFKKFFFSTLGGTVGAAGIGIWMANAGYGVWALVAQQLFNTFVDTIILWMTVRWHPKFVFSFKRLKVLFEYGWKLLASALLDITYEEARQLIIGRIYSSADLAFYNRGNQFPKLIIANVNSAIDSVLLPTMSREQDNKVRVKSMTRRSIMISIYVIAPLMIGLAACADTIVKLVLTEKWLPSVFYIRVFCICYMFWPIHTANLNAIKAMGRSDLFLKLEIAKKVIGVGVLLATMFISVEAMACSLLFTSLTSQVINSWPNRRLLGYRYIEQLTDILPGIGLALVMGAIVYQFQYIGLSNLCTLFLQIMVGAFIYIIGSFVLRLESFFYLIGVIKSYLKK